MFSCGLFPPSSSLSDFLMCGIYWCRDVQKWIATQVVRHHLLIVTNVEKDILHGVAINLGRSMSKEIFTCFFAKTFKHAYLEQKHTCQNVHKRDASWTSTGHITRITWSKSYLVLSSKIITLFLNEFRLLDECGSLIFAQGIYTGSCWWMVWVLHS